MKTSLSKKEPMAKQIVITMAIFLGSSQAENFTNTNDMTALQALYQRESFFLCT